MKRALLLSFAGLLLASSFAFAGFDELLKDVLLETGNQMIGSTDYVFSPGDAVIKKDTYVVYYSGSEVAGSSRILRLTLVTSQGPLVLKYPDPAIIKVRTYQLQVLSFDNVGLKVRVLGSQ